MDVSRREAILWISAAAVTCAEGAEAQGERHILPGVDRYRFVEPMYECVRVVLAKRGERYSPAYVQGVSGAAFRVAGPCPCAPTCCGAMGVENLARLFGYECETLLFKEGADPQVWLGETLARVRAEIRAGRPVIMFHAFTSAEWDVVCGYDEGSKKLYGRGSYAGLKEYAVADEGRTLTSKEICGIIGPTLVGAKTGAFDAPKAEVAALREAVRFARSTSEKIPFRGLQCYDRWIARFQADPPTVPDFGEDGYTSGIYSSTRKAAAAFLRELKPKYRRSGDALEHAARYFGRESFELARFRALLFPEAKGAVRLEPRERNARAVALLTGARDAYRAGIEQIEKALTTI